MSFLRGGQTLSNDPVRVRESAARSSIKDGIVAAIKEVQCEHTGERFDQPVDISELGANKLCAAFEALFLHGTKHSFLGKLLGFSGPKSPSPSSSTASARNGNLPDTNFWTAVMAFAHRDMIERIKGLSQIKTDVGRSRAWVRLAFNEGVIASFLTNMNNATRRLLSEFYEHHAFVMDYDTMDVIAKYMLGVQVYKFDLALNSSILNRWQTPALVMCGLWVPDRLVEEAPVTAVDALAQMDKAEEAKEASAAAEAETNAAMKRFRPAYSANSYLGGGLLNEDEALAIILQSTGGTPKSRSKHESPVHSPYNSNHGSPIDRGPLSQRAMRNNGHKQQQPSRRALARVTESKQEAEEERKRAAEAKVEERRGVKARKQILSENPTEDAPATETGTDDSGTSSAVVDDASAQLDTSSTDPEDSIYGTGAETDGEKSRTHSETGTIPKKTPPPEKRSKGVEEARTAPKTASLVNQIIEGLEEHNRKRESSSSTASSSRVSTPRRGSISAVDTEKDPPDGVLATAAQRVAETVDVAMPYLSGFIESWNPFGGGRFFDTPPNPEERSNSPKLGFFLQVIDNLGRDSPIYLQFFYLFSKSLLNCF
jgi:hypothetical protein